MKLPITSDCYIQLIEEEDHEGNGQSGILRHPEDIPVELLELRLNEHIENSLFDDDDSTVTSCSSLDHNEVFGGASTSYSYSLFTTMGDMTITRSECTHPSKDTSSSELSVEDFPDNDSLNLSRNRKISRYTRPRRTKREPQDENEEEVDSWMLPSTGSTYSIDLSLEALEELRETCPGSAIANMLVLRG